MDDNKRGTSQLASDDDGRVESGEIARDVEGKAEQRGPGTARRTMRPAAAGAMQQQHRFPGLVDQIAAATRETNDGVTNPPPFQMAWPSP